MRGPSRSWPLPLAAAAAIALAAAPARADDALARSIAAVPFGAGQFQNGDTALGICFAAGEALLGGASIATMLLANHLASVTPSGPTQPAAVASLNQRIDGTVTANRVSFAGWAALTAAGIIEAEVTFAPRRAAPPDGERPSLSATLAAVPGGGFLGLRGRF